MLTGAAPLDAGTLETLLAESDYLYAHFPDFAARTPCRPPVEDLAFIKRIRVELDSFLSILNTDWEW
jgi:hypothetical protein